LILFVAAMLIADTHRGVQYISPSHSIAGEGKGKCDGMNGLTNMVLCVEHGVDTARAFPAVFDL
jgi:hypothetical protein